MPWIDANEGNVNLDQVVSVAPFQLADDTYVLRLHTVDGGVHPLPTGYPDLAAARAAARDLVSNQTTF